MLRQLSKEGECFCPTKSLIFYNTNKTKAGYKFSLFLFLKNILSKCFARKHIFIYLCSTNNINTNTSIKMNIDWTTILTSLVSLIAGGGLASLFTIKQTRQSKDIENASKLVEEYRTLLEGYKQTAEDNKQRVEELTAEVNDLNRKLSIAETKIENLQLLYNNANYLRCNNLHCKMRTPPIEKDVLKMLLATSSEEDKKEGE